MDGVLALVIVPTREVSLKSRQFSRSILKYDVHEWQGFVDEVRGSVVTFPGKVGNTTQINLTPYHNTALSMYIYAHLS